MRPCSGQAGGEQAPFLLCSGLRGTDEARTLGVGDSFLTVATPLTCDLVQEPP